ncbi:MAG: HAD family hydrolase [Candidatus Moranbacteria bacterium]|nr:HAD family hydrolase [Candidatus Moranbacteria bacterium]
MIRSVIFDVDGVLLDSFEGNLKFFQDLSRYAGCRPLTREEYAGMVHLSMWDMVKELSGLTSESEIRAIYDIGKNRVVPYPLDLLQVPVDTAQTIETLGSLYLLGIVTSRVRSSVFEAPRLAELESYFKVTVTFEDTENHKPSPDPLLLAVNRLGVRPEESVYVGDTESDVRAARAAGMKIVLYSKTDRYDADAFVPTLGALPDVIASF